MLVGEYQFTLGDRILFGGADCDTQNPSPATSLGESIWCRIAGGKAETLSFGEQKVPPKSQGKSSRAGRRHAAVRSPANDAVQVAPDLRDSTSG